MITDFFFTLMGYSTNWALSFFPSLSTADTSTVVGNIIASIDFITSFMGIAMYVFPWYQTVMQIFGIWILYNGSKFVIFLITWVSSIVPMSPMNELDIR